MISDDVEDRLERVIQRLLSRRLRDAMAAQGHVGCLSFDRSIATRCVHSSNFWSIQQESISVGQFSD